MGILEKIKVRASSPHVEMTWSQEIELEMARTQRNKATEHHFGMLKAKLARYRAMLLEPQGKGKGGGDGFEVQKNGDARVALIGFPSVGKSTILSKLTETESAVAAYEFTTLTCIPGVVKYRGANIQLLDLPGIIEGASEGKGRGRQVIAVARTSDMIVMMLDASKGTVQRRLLEQELEAVGIRLNRGPPDISFHIKKGGGLKINSVVPLTHLDNRLIYGVLHEYKIFNAEILFRCDATVDEFIDVVEGKRAYLRCLYVYNKIDTLTIEEVDQLARTPDTIVISCELDLNLDYMLAKMWEYLQLIRIYTKRPSTAPDFNGPVIIRSGTTVQGVCQTIHRDLARDFRYALVWGTSSKHNPQRVGLTHVLQDEDVIQIVKKM